MKLFLTRSRKSFDACKDGPVTPGDAVEPKGSSPRAVLLVVAALMAVVPELALAAPWDSAAQSVLEIFTGGLSRTVAIIAVIACGIAALMGKLQWNWAINIVLGIVLIFGGATFVDYIIAASA